MTLLVSEDMMEAARLVHPAGDVFGFPGKGHLLDLASGSPMKAAGTIARFLENVRTVSFDRLFQLNHDGTGALLGKLLPAGEKRGFFSLHDRIIPGEEKGKNCPAGPPILWHPPGVSGPSTGFICPMSGSGLVFPDPRERERIVSGLRPRAPVRSAWFSRAEAFTGNLFWRMWRVWWTGSRG